MSSEMMVKGIAAERKVKENKGVRRLVGVTKQMPFFEPASCFVCQLLVARESVTLHARKVAFQNSFSFAIFLFLFLKHVKLFIMNIHQNPIPIQKPWFFLSSQKNKKNSKHHAFVFIVLTVFEHTSSGLVLCTMHAHKLQSESKNLDKREKTCQ